MGQLIEVDRLVLGDVAVFDTDRSFSGQEGETYAGAAAAEASGTFPGLVASALFAEFPSIVSVYVFSNTISVRNRGGWAEEQADAAAGIIRNSLVHYAANRR